MQRRPAARAIPASLRTLLALGVAVIGMSNAGAQPPDAERGRAMYENHCQFCHTAQIHSRPGKLPLTRAELRDIVNHWRRLQGLRWAEQDTEDVVEYLNLTRYRFPVGE